MRYFSASGRQLRTERRKARVVFYGLSLIVLLYLLLSVIFGERGVLTYMKLRRTNESLQNELVQLKAVNNRLKEEVSLLKHPNPFFIEKKAREDLNMAREDEYIFIFQSQGK